MIIVKLQGGLGNQMFQYAIGRRMALLHKIDLKLDLTELTDRTPKANFTFRDYELGVFQINPLIAEEREVSIFNRNDIFSKIKRLFCPTKLIQEKNLNFNPTILNSGDQVYLNGYWQSERYFDNIRTVLLSDFKLRQSFLEKYTANERIKIIKKQIETPPSVSVHFRRGDYITDSITNSVHGTCNIDYYRKAINLIREKVASVHLFLFSDDPEWVLKNHLFDDFPATSVATSDKHLDMYLMSLCQHNIIANSSFSWWAAWLNQNPEKLVIAPQRWFANNELNQQTQDLIPQNWIRL